MVILYSGAGRGDPYYVSSDGKYTAPEGHFTVIIKKTDGSLLLRNANGTICQFYPLDETPQAGQLAAIITRCGERLSFEYNSDGLLATALDSYKRPIQFTYNPDKRLEKITAFTGQEVRYSYDEHGHLVAVTSPAVTGTVTGNDFPEGKQWRYTYSHGNANEALNHNLLTVTAPNEVAGNGPPQITNYYNEDDRLISQQWGNTNSSGVSAGGTVYYSREEQNVGIDPDNVTLAREVVTVIDRVGNETVFSFNKNKQLIKKEVKTRNLRPGDPAAYVTEYSYNLVGLLKEQKFPAGNRVVYEYDETNANILQQANVIAKTIYPGPREADQQQIKVTYAYEPVFNQLWKATGPRGTDPNFTPPNGGTADAQRYTIEYVPDYFEGGLDTPGCACGYTLRQLVETFGIDISPIQSQLNQGDLNGDGTYSLCGNLIVRRYPTVRLRPDSPQIAAEGSNQQTIIAKICYNKFGQVESIETPEGEITQYFYYPENDPDGDGQDILQGTNDRGQPYDGNTGGFLKQVIRDYRHSTNYRSNSAPAQISIRFGYQHAGNIIWMIDGRGVRTDFKVNQLNQIVEVVRAADVSQSPENGLAAYGYRTRVYYDFNNNVIKSEVEYRDGNNPNLPQWLSTTYIYDILDNLLEVTRTVDATTTITSRVRYDANENIIERLTPLAVAGIQPGNKIQISYDERDLPYQLIAAPGTSDQATISYFYDANGNRSKTVDAYDNNGDGQGEASTYFVDGFDRIVRSVDAAGNETRLHYDPASNIISSEVWGTIGGPTRSNNSSTGNVLLAKGAAYFDELGRLYQREAELFVPVGVATVRAPIISEGDLNPSDGKITSFIDYDRNSRITFATAASPASALEQTRFYYDGLGRSTRIINAEGSEVTREYDNNSNAIKTTLVEVHATGRIAAETFVSYNVFDALNRLSRTTDNVGQTRRIYYDSRNLAIKTSDAQGPETPDPLGIYPAGNINSDGNISHIIHDGLGRTLRTIQELTVSGQGGNPIDQSNPSNPDGKISEETSYDANSRVTAVADDKGNATGYAYDNQNRLVLTTFADGTSKSIEYNADSQPIKTIDNSGTIVQNTFDGLGRPIRRDIILAPGFKGTTLQTFEYDGLSRLTKATDNNDPAKSEDDSSVERRYDSLSRLLEEQQNGKVVSYNWTQAGDPVDFTYPNNRKIEYTLDKLNRLRTIKNSGATGNIAGYDYIGGRMIERIHGNGTRLTTLNDAGTANEGYDRLGRLIKMRHLKNTVLIAGFAYGYNRESIKTYREDLKYPQLSELYRYDSLYRLVDFQRGTLSADKDAITGTVTSSQTWQLDGVGNWASTVVDGQAKTQTVNAMNEYDSFGGEAQVHDDNGNLTDDGQHLFTYDFANRLLEVRQKGENGQANTLVGLYTYDAFNRRISKQITRTREGEYQTDANTLALYHFNNTSGKIIDSSGNNNHAKAPKHIVRGQEGLWNTKAVKFCAVPIKVRKDKSLDNIADQLTVETWVYLKSPKCQCQKHGKYNKHKPHCPWRRFWKKWQGGSLLHRPGSYRLAIQGCSRKATFTLLTKEEKNKKHGRCGSFKTHEICIKSDDSLPTDQWVHVAAVYDGQKATLYVDSQKQRDTETISGDVKKSCAHLFLGGIGFTGMMEEARISNTARANFGGTIRETVLRQFFYSGWSCLEEHEKIAPEGGSFGTEKVTRQFVEGANIDEHICVDYYGEEGTAVERTLWYHQNARGDVVALTDADGEVFVELRYSAFGVAYKINEQGQLEEFCDFSVVVFGFQGLTFDEETKFYYARHRYYSAQQGRWLSRDPLGYVDGYNLYEAFGGNSLSSIDPLGLDEVDDNPILGKELPDATEKINEYVNMLIKNAICNVNKAKSERYDWYKNMEDWQIAMDLMIRSVGTLENILFRFGVENDLRTFAKDYVKLVSIKDTKYKNAYSAYSYSDFSRESIYWKYKTISGFGIIKINGLTIGLDKLSHFLTTGGRYYCENHYINSTPQEKSIYGDEFIKAFGPWLEGKKTTDNPKIVEALQRSNMDIGIHGFSTTGVFSYADIEANEQGYRFFKELATTFKYSFQYKDFDIKFDIKSYINKNWSEYCNPNQYSQKLSKVLETK